MDIKFNENQVVNLIRHVASDDDMEFMDTHEFGIADVLNDRVQKDKVPMDKLEEMVTKWNDDLGVTVIKGY